MIFMAGVIRINWLVYMCCYFLCMAGTYELFELYSYIESCMVKLDNLAAVTTYYRLTSSEGIGKSTYLDSGCQG